MPRLAGYDWRGKNSKQITYIAANNSIQEFYKIEGEDWALNELTAPNAFQPWSVSGFEWSPLKEKDVVFNTPDGHIHLLATNLDAKAPLHVDLFDGSHIAGSANIPMASTNTVTDVCGYEWSALNTRQIVYSGGELWQSLGLDPHWHYGDLGQASGTPFKRGVWSPGYDWPAGATKQVLGFPGVNEGHLYWAGVTKGAGWTSVDLSVSAGLPSTSPSSTAWSKVIAWASGFAAKSSDCVACVDVVGELYLLARAPGEKSWSVEPLAPFIPPTVGGVGASVWGLDWLAGGYRQVYFVTNDDGHIHELYQAFDNLVGAWGHADLTKETGAPPARKEFHPILAVFEWRAGSSKQVAYVGVDGHLHELSVAVNSNWQHRQLTGKAPFLSAPLPL